MAGNLTLEVSSVLANSNPFQGTNTGSAPCEREIRQTRGVQAWETRERGKCEEGEVQAAGFADFARLVSPLLTAVYLSFCLGEGGSLLVRYNIHTCTGLTIPLHFYRPPRIRGFRRAHLRVGPLDLQDILLTLSRFVMFLLCFGWLGCCMTSSEHI